MAFQYVGMECTESLQQLFREALRTTLEQQGDCVCGGEGTLRKSNAGVSWCQGNCCTAVRRAAALVFTGINSLYNGVIDIYW